MSKHTHGLDQLCKWIVEERCTLGVDGGKLWLEPAGRASAELRIAVLQHKQALLKRFGDADPFDWIDQRWPTSDAA